MWRSVVYCEFGVDVEYVYEELVEESEESDVEISMIGMLNEQSVEDDLFCDISVVV